MINFSQQEFEKYYIKEKGTIGVGAFGKVFLVTHRITNKKFALKEITGKG